MKKHKSVVAILLAVMMVFTFMPTMAFATVSWDANYKTPVSDISSAGTQKAVYTWTDGVIKAESKWAGTSTYGEADGFDDTANGIKYFYDLAGATITADGGKAIAKTLTVSQYAGLLEKLELNMVQPSYTFAEGQTVAQKANPVVITPGTDEAAPYFGLGAFTFELASNFDPEVTTDQDVTISFKKTTSVKSGVGDTVGAADVLGDVPVVNVTVKADAATIGGAKFYYEDQDATKAEVGWALGEWGNKALTAQNVAYDGAAHTIAMTPVEGYSVAYAIFNSSTGRYDAVDAVTLTDVDKAVSVKATVTKAATATAKAESKEYTFDVKVVAAKAPTFGFKSTSDISYEVKDGTAYDPYDFIEVKDPANATDADKAAVKANEASLMEFFKAYYGITESAPATNPHDITFTIGKYADTVKTGKEVDPKYEQLLANFGTTKTAGFGTGGQTHWFEIVDAADWFEIEFVNSPTSKTYKAKVLKKKAKTFKVKAEATNGEAVNYKLINAPEKIRIDRNTGKITLKKGLKKGTYKITVKAYIPKSYMRYDGSLYYPSETHKITIKVKK